LEANIAEIRKLRVTPRLDLEVGVEQLAETGQLINP
jgi:hypothetical protein